jgi:hypothetical protein
MAYSRTRSRSSRSSDIAHDVAYGLGWFSIALGVAEIAAPRSLSRMLGMEGHERLIQAYGLREIATGIGILSSDNPAPWIWGRVAGDALDIATVATALHDGNRQRDNVKVTLAALAGVTAIDAACAQALTMDQKQPQRIFDYSDRSGLPRSPASMRGAARDFDIPDDMRAPEALRPYTEGSGGGSGVSSPS